MIDKIKELNSTTIDADWVIFDDKEAIPADQQDHMRAALLKNYDRAVALLDGQEGLNKEQEIADLEYKRAELQEQARLQKAKLAAEYRLKHVELEEQTNAAVALKKKELEIKKNAELETLNIKASIIVPVKEELPRRWWQRLFRRPVQYYTNLAYELAEQKAILESNDYLTACEDENIKLEAAQSGTDELELAVIKVMQKYTGGKTRGRKVKAVNKALSELITPLCAMFARRERALEELNKRLDEDNNNAFDEPLHKDFYSQNAEGDREELQRKAAGLLSAFCVKRIQELQQQEKPNKPKRHRIREKKND